MKLKQVLRLKENTVFECDPHNLEFVKGSVFLLDDFEVLFKAKDCFNDEISYKHNFEFIRFKKDLVENYKDSIEVVFDLEKIQKEEDEDKQKIDLYYKRGR